MSATATSHPLIAITGLTLRFQGLTALHQVSFALHAGEILSIIGPNGAGKTSLFNVLSGVYQPTEGEVHCNGEPLREPLTAKGYLLAATVAATSAVGLTVLANAQALWDAAIVALYAYQQSFPWHQVPGEFWGALVAQPRLDTLAPAVMGALGGWFASLILQRQSGSGPRVSVSRGIARTFQNIKLFPELSALDNVRLGMERLLTTGFWSAALRLPAFHQERKDSSLVAEELLAFVGLSAMRDHPAGALPYGVQRRLEIARALATDPKVILLDEPAAGLNPTESQELLSVIRKIRERGVTVALIEHDMGVVMQISDRIIVLDHGEKIAEGTPAEVRCNPAVLEAYLGKEECGDG